MKLTRQQLKRELDAADWRSGIEPYVRGKRPSRFLQILRHNAHVAFDRLWKNGYMTRDQAYRVLADLTGLPRELSHFRLFDGLQCAVAMEYFEGLIGGRPEQAAMMRRLDRSSRQRTRQFRRRRTELDAIDSRDLVAAEGRAA